jgi:hypothetical protein
MWRRLWLAKLDLLILVLGVICAWVMLSSSSDPIVSWLRGTALEAAFVQFPTGNQIAFDLSVGVISALITYYLLVRLPEHERKRRIKKHLLFSYQAFKESAIQTFLGCANDSYSLDDVALLSSQSAFRRHFKESVAQGQEKWDVVANNIEDFHIRQLVIEAEVLLGEFQHAISAVDVPDPEVFKFMKHLSSVLYRAKNWSSDYDGVKQVLRFFWQLLAGWDPVKGYQDEEYVVAMLRRI